MFHVDVQDFLVKENDVEFYKIPVIPVLFSDFWRRNQSIIDPANEVTLRYEPDNVCYVLTPLHNVKVANIILNACGDPRVIFS